jgi:hypothetical protein
MFVATHGQILDASGRFFSKRCFVKQPTNLEVLKGDRLLQAWVTTSNEVVFAHPPAEPGQEEATNRNKASSEWQQIDHFELDGSTMSVVKGGHDQPVHIGKVDNQHPDRGDEQGKLVPLDVSRHQEKEGEHKVTEYQENAQARPLSIDTVLVPHGFFGDIAVPNQHELGKGSICPEDIEAVHHLAEVMVVLSGHNAIEEAHATEHNDHDSQE